MNGTDSGNTTDSNAAGSDMTPPAAGTESHHARSHSHSHSHGHSRGDNNGGDGDGGQEDSILNRWFFVAGVVVGVAIMIGVGAYVFQRSIPPPTERVVERCM